MELESIVKQEAESGEVQISEQHTNRLTRVMEHFKREIHQREGIEGVYYSLSSLRTAITLGAVTCDNLEDYQEVLDGKVPFHVQEGSVFCTEYYFCDGKRGYRTKTRVFSRGAFSPLLVGGVRD